MPHAIGALVKTGLAADGWLRAVLDAGTDPASDHVGDFLSLFGTQLASDTVGDVRANLGWAPRVSGSLGETPPPTEDELRLIRTQLDPQGMYTS